MSCTATETGLFNALLVTRPGSPLESEAADYEPLLVQAVNRALSSTGKYVGTREGACGVSISVAHFDDSDGRSVIVCSITVIHETPSIIAVTPGLRTVDENANPTFVTPGAFLLLACSGTIPTESATAIIDALRKRQDDQEEYTEVLTDLLRSYCGPEFASLVRLIRGVSQSDQTVDQKMEFVVGRINSFLVKHAESHLCAALSGQFCEDAEDCCHEGAEDAEDAEDCCHDAFGELFRAYLENHRPELKSRLQNLAEDPAVESYDLLVETLIDYARPMLMIMPPPVTCSEAIGASDYSEARGILAATSDPDAADSWRSVAEHLGCNYFGSLDHLKALAYGETLPPFVTSYMSARIYDADICLVLPCGDAVARSSDRLRNAIATLNPSALVADSPESLVHAVDRYTHRILNRMDGVQNAVLLRAYQGTRAVGEAFDR